MERDEPVFKAFKYLAWDDLQAQLAFYINTKYWMPKSNLLVRWLAQEEVFELCLIGRDTNWRTKCDIFNIKTDPDKN